jgi:hypothetical protein
MTITYMMNDGTLNRRCDAPLDDFDRPGRLRGRNVYNPLDNAGRCFNRNRHFDRDGHRYFDDLANLLVRSARSHRLRHRVDAR